MSSDFRAKMKLLSFLYFGVMFFAAIISGCTANLPKGSLFPPRTDTIPGILTPSERIEMIRLKGEHGRNSHFDTKKKLLEQLVEEYANSPDTLVRQEVVSAVSRFLASSPITDGNGADNKGDVLPEAFDLIKYAAMRDEDPFVRREACRVIIKINQTETAIVLRHVARNDPDKDVQLMAINGLSKFDDQDTIETLGQILDHRQPALRYEAMQSLKVCTKKDFGNDVALWKQYFDGETPGPVKPPTLAERFPMLPMIR